MLKEKINQDIKQAMINKEELLLLVLRGINAVIYNKEIEKRTKLSKQEKDIKKLEKESKLTDEEIIDVISGEAKKRRESIEEFTKGDRQDLVDKETKELEIIKKYLPEQMSEDAVKKIVKKAIIDTGAAGPKDIGKLMSAVMPQVKGKTDGTVVNKIVGELLK
ncbi:GatB/YqeY domain-containing protein [Patescibacteria group bacterium]|nr:GatB/YqeY domain-containing protein [Patescibacteria group bacterium]MBU4458614.1 GatB/YqeY domain-containing protein [Patescibacteria group bacterium]MCG2696249.1 GatB/YqeY domain-containing protein [Candidatus Portnoybacteria bacterium]